MSEPSVRGEGLLGIHRLPPLHRRASTTNPTYKLSEEDRDAIAILYWLDLWPDAVIAKHFGVDRALIKRTAATRGLEG